MNWLYFALTVSAVLVAAWLIIALRARPAWPGLIGGVGFLLVAGLNSAAPVRGLVDPDYVGFAFGFLRAERGLLVTLLAGALFLSAVLAAFTALQRERWAMAYTAAAAAATSSSARRVASCAAAPLREPSLRSCASCSVSTRATCSRCCRRRKPLRISNAPSSRFSP